MKRPVVLLALLAFIAIACWNLGSLGLYYDEMLFVNAALGAPHNMFIHYKLGEVPIMLMSYIGALKAWLYYPIFGLFGVSTLTVRLPVILIGGLTLWLNSRVVANAFSEKAALLFLLMAAVEPTTIFHTRLDWGPTALMMLFRSLMLLNTILWLKTQQKRYLAFAVTAIVFGTFDKLNFLWFAPGLAAAVLLVYPREVFDFIKSQWRFCSALAAVIALLALGLLAYTKSNLPLEEEIGHMDWSFRWIVVTRLLLGALSGVNVYATVTMNTDDVTLAKPHLWVLLGALAVALCVFIRCRQWQRLRSFVFLLLFSLFTLVALFVTKQATGPHHIATLAPLWLMLLAALLSPAFEAGQHTWLRGLAALAVTVVMISALRIDQRNLAAFSNNPKHAWDPGINELAPIASQHAGEPVITIDWGSGTTIVGLLKGNVDIRDDWMSFRTPPTEETARHYEELIQYKKPIFIVPANGEAEMPETRENFLALVKLRNWQLEPVTVINSARSSPLFEIYSVRLPAESP